MGMFGKCKGPGWGGGAWQPPLAAEEPDPVKVQVWTLPPGEQPVWPRCELGEGACQLNKAPPPPCRLGVDFGRCQPPPGCLPCPHPS